MNTNHTYEQIALDYTLWTELVDIDGNMSRETFDNTPVSELVAMMIDMFGAEENDERITVSISEDGIWATDAHLVRGKWQDGATLIPDEDGCPSDADDALYAQIKAAAIAGNTDGSIEAEDHVYTWKIS